MPLPFNGAGNGGSVLREAAKLRDADEAVEGRLGGLAPVDPREAGPACRPHWTTA